MPRRWYFGGLIGFLVWGCLICLVGPKIPGPPRLFELSGTLLTLLPVGLDLLRKYYVKRNMPSSQDAEWALKLVRQAFLGFESLYAWAVFLGISFIALGFAKDFFRGV